MRAVLLLATVLLSACVLHSKTPIFSDAEAVLALGGQPLTFAVSDFENGAWVANEEPFLRASPEGRHYLVPDPNSPKDLTKADRYYLVPLSPGRYVIEALSGGEADYVIATWDGTTLLVSPLDCALLKTSLKTNALVMFGSDTCTFRPSDTPPVALFTILAQQAAKPTLRFVRQ